MNNLRKFPPFAAASYVVCSNYSPKLHHHAYHFSKAWIWLCFKRESERNADLTFGTVWLLLTIKIYQNIWEHLRSECYLLTPSIPVFHVHLNNNLPTPPLYHWAPPLSSTTELHHLIIMHSLDCTARLLNISTSPQSHLNYLEKCNPTTQPAWLRTLSQPSYC